MSLVHLEQPEVSEGFSCFALGKQAKLLKALACFWVFFSLVSLIQPPSQEKHGHILQGGRVKYGHKISQSCTCKALGFY